MKYISVREAGFRWGIDPSRIGRLIREGRIEGAKRSGRSWLIPENAQKPADGRTRQVKAQPREIFFRFPLFADFEEESFIPPLSPEEAALRRAQKDYYACEYESAKNAFAPLSERAESIYVRICASYFMCILSASYDIKISWEQYYHRLNLLLNEDFPYKKEMELFLPWLDCNLARFRTAGERLDKDPTYEYHPSARYTCAWLSLLRYSSENMAEIPKFTLEPYEILCGLAERDGHYTEAQELHFILFTACFMIHEKDAMLYHLRRVLHIACEHDLLPVAADMASYYPDVFESVLSEYPASFAEKLRENSRLLYRNFLRFAENRNRTKLYARLSKNDYRLVLYAYSGCSNKKVAGMLQVSERSVASRYNELYNKLGVAGKAELVALMRDALEDQ